MYNWGNKFIFVAHPRTASRSISEVLKKGGCTMQGNHHYMDEALCEDVRDANGIVACVKRNMFDVLVSWFHRSISHTPTPPTAPVTDFTKWLEIVMKGGHMYLDVPVYHYGMKYANWVMRYERIESELTALLFRAELPRLKMEHEGKSDRFHYQNYYTPVTVRRVEDRWGEDLNITNYKFEE